jgi:tellurite methyltransferase
MRILDAGCGSGRNIGYLLRAGFDVSAVDEATAAVDSVRGLARRFAPTLPERSFRTEAIEKLSFDDASFDFIISSAVLHFARGEEHFRSMLDAMWRTLRRDGLLFARLASTIGMPAESFTPIGDRRFHLPDGSERFLVDEDLLSAETDRLGAQLGDPIKTTVVQNARCMTTWVLRKA